MLEWLKKNWTLLLTGSVLCVFLFFGYACGPRTQSLIYDDKKVNRQELQLELDQLIGTAQIRMIDLEQQDQLRAIILQNALILVQGQPLNPLGIITALAGIYGITQGGKNITTVVKKKLVKVNNG